jgi:serine-type D-Ala-D-Ala carboxypeptidase/endopeptidase
MKGATPIVPLYNADGRSERSSREKSDMDHPLQALHYVLFLLLFLPSASICAQPIESLIDPLVAPYIESGNAMGISVGVVRKGERFAKGYGKLSESDPRSPNAETLFEIGSISKTFTGILLADAVEKGELKLNQPIQELLPDALELKLFDDKPISLQHLSTHVSGLPRMPTNFRPKQPDNPYADYTSDSLFAFLKKFKPTRPPEKKMEYSNIGVGLLGWLLAKRANTDYESLLKKTILEPLKMEDTAIVLTPELLSRLAPPHNPDGELTSVWDIHHLPGMGGIRSTVNDMLKYLDANLNPPDNLFGKAIDLAWQTHQEPIQKKDFAMGLGWHLASDGHTHWHTGGTGGFRTALFIDRRSQTGVVVLSNKSHPEIIGLAESMIQRLFGMDVEPRKFDPVVKVPPEVMRKYLGRFRLGLFSVFTVTMVDEKLMVQLTGQETFRVYPQSETAWKYKVVDAVLTFEVGEDGKCHSLDLFQNGIHQKAKRIE